DDILDLSKVEAGKMEIIGQDFDPRALVQRMISLYSVPARNKGLEIQMQLESAMPQQIHGDPYRLEQVLRNVVSNAVKFTEQGRIDILASVRQRTQSKVILDFQVQDTGPGIAQEDVESLFDSFSQGDSSFAKKHQGTGLGLAISRELVRLMGGKLEVQSEPGKGSTFAIVLPFTWPDKTSAAWPPEIKEPAPEIRPLHILVTEDVPLNQEYIHFLLHRHGHSATIVATGEEALAYFAAGSYDVVLMDIQMPDMNGMEATRRLRQQEGGDKPLTPIIALTAYARPEEREKFLAAGMNGYVSKPIDAHKLWAEIQRVLDSPAETTAPPATETNAETTVPSPAATTGPKEERLFDMEQIQERFGGDTALWTKILNRFIQEELSEYRSQLQSLAKQPDFPETARIAHKLKGALGTLGAVAAFAAAKDLHHAAQNRDPEAVQRHWQRLSRQLQALAEDGAPMGPET
ncbi:MAG: ATP-binding protein, partial [Desulfohalobium sp.]